MLKFGDKEVFIFAVIYPGTLLSLRESHMELHLDGLCRKLRWLTLASHQMTFQAISKSQFQLQNKIITSFDGTFAMLLWSFGVWWS